MSGGFRNVQVDLSGLRGLRYRAHPATEHDADAFVEEISVLMKYLKGKKPSEVCFEELNASVQPELKPPKSVKASPKVRRRMVESHLKIMTSGK